VVLLTLAAVSCSAPPTDNDGGSGGGSIGGGSGGSGGGTSTGGGSGGGASTGGGSGGGTSTGGGSGGGSGGGVAGPVPAAPTAVVAIAGNARATVQWNSPANDAGISITGYIATSTPGGFTATTRGATQAIVSGLSNGTSYTFTV